MSKVHDYKQGNGDVQVSNGYYAVDPSGHLILVPPLQSLKDGWRLATADDFRPAAADAPVEIDTAPEPEPVVIDEPVEAFVESIEIDAPVGDERD